MAGMGKTPITRDIFNGWLIHDRRMIDILEELDIDTATKFELFDMLDVDMGGELEFGELVDGLMHVRGPIAKIDIVATRLSVRYLTRMMECVCHELGCDMMEVEKAKRMVNPALTTTTTFNK